MGSDGLCSEYIAGCCPYEEFSVPSITKRCPRVHDRALRESCTRDGEGQSFGAAALRTYRAIVDDTEKRILYNEQCISNVNSAEDVFKALDYTEQLISEKDVGPDDSASLYCLLKIHGKLLERAMDGGARGKQYSVCKNCGALKAGGDCQHQFCAGYSKIRRLVKELEARLR